MHGIFFNPPIEQNYIGHIMAEVFKDGIYQPFLKGRKDLTILDIGANVGITAYYFSKFAKKVYAMEPSLEHYDILTQMIKFNKLDNVEAHKQALYIKDGTFQLFHQGNKTAHSLLEVPGNVGREPVNCVTLKTFLDTHKIKNVDFLKMDIEGAEAEVFGNAGFRDVADKIQTMIFETHSWSGRHPNQIRDSLTSLGFNVNQIPNDAALFVATR